MVAAAAAAAAAVVKASPAAKRSLSPLKPKKIGLSVRSEMPKQGLCGNQAKKRGDGNSRIARE